MRKLEVNRKMTNGNDVTHNTKHTILFNKTKFTPYSVPPAHKPSSVNVSAFSGELLDLVDYT